MDNRQVKLPVASENGMDCQKFVFPFDRRIGRIRDVTRKWTAKQIEEDKRAYEIMVGTVIRESLARIGFGDALIDAELAKFWRAVQAELDRIYACGPPHPVVGA